MHLSRSSFIMKVLMKVVCSESRPPNRSHMMRVMILASRACSSSMVGAGTSWKIAALSLFR